MPYPLTSASALNTTGMAMSESHTEGKEGKAHATPALQGPYDYSARKHFRGSESNAKTTGPGEMIMGGLTTPPHGPAGDF